MKWLSAFEWSLSSWRCTGGEETEKGGTLETNILCRTGMETNAYVSRNLRGLAGPKVIWMPKTGWCITFFGLTLQPNVCVFTPHTHARTPTCGIMGPMPSVPQRQSATTRNAVLESQERLASHSLQLFKKLSLMGLVENACFRFKPSKHLCSTYCRLVSLTNIIFSFNKHNNKHIS